MGNSVEKYETYNTTSIEYLMDILIFRFDFFNWDQKDKDTVVPFDRKFYEDMEKDMEGFIKFYKSKKKDSYMPSGGFEKMFPCKLIEKVFLMNKRDEDIKDIINIWSTRRDTDTSEYISFRVERHNLKD